MQSEDGCTMTEEGDMVVRGVRGYLFATGLQLVASFVV
jgi:hypothetical protein